MSIECTTSANSTVTCLYSAGLVSGLIGEPQEWQNRASSSGSVPHVPHVVAVVIRFAADPSPPSAKDKLFDR
jgi:hypothetical protein